MHASQRREIASPVYRAVEAVHRRCLKVEKLSETREAVQACRSCVKKSCLKLRKLSEAREAG